MSRVPYILDFHGQFVFPGSQALVTQGKEIRMASLEGTVATRIILLLFIIVKSWKQSKCPTVED